MNRFLIPCCFASALLLGACQGNKDPESTGQGAATDTPSASVMPSTVSDTPVQDMQQLSGSGIQPAQSAAASGEALNPPHGEPGHRCEIPVGAPLSSAPAASAAAPTITQSGQPVQLPTAQQGSVTQKVELQSAPGSPQTIMATPSAPGTAPATTAPGMNPPHGQPGHDCSIAVGAPLKK